MSDPRITWDDQVKGFFAQGEIGCMRPIEKVPPTGGDKCPIDLSSYDSVKLFAPMIYTVVENGAMPLNGRRWSAERVAEFQSWIDGGCPRS